MNDLNRFFELLFKFTPWLLFFWLAGPSLASLKVAILVGLAASLVFGYADMKRVLLIPWGTFLFFGFSALSVNLFRGVWVVANVELLAKVVLAGLMWFSLLVGQPFAWQYARRDLPKQRWQEPTLLRSGRFISLVWACLMSLAVALAMLRRSAWPQLPAVVDLTAALLLIAIAFVVTSLDQRRQRRPRAKGWLKR